MSILRRKSTLICLFIIHLEILPTSSVYPLLIQMHFIAIISEDPSSRTCILKLLIVPLLLYFGIYLLKGQGFFQVTRSWLVVLNKLKLARHIVSMRRNILFLRGRLRKLSSTFLVFVGRCPTPLWAFVLVV